MNEQRTNPATLWAETAVAALVGAGLRDVCVAPGSRSTALVLAFAAHPDVRVYRHLDERSAGFFALGLALVLDRPVALLCTSGTAAANFFPAIIEARMAQVPLLALTADRPPERRHSGANQTINQIRLYGEQVLWSVDVPLPEQEPADVALRNLRALMARACARAVGLPKGPVHLNFPFRKPFEPQGKEDGDIRFLQEIGYLSRAVTQTPRIVRGALAPPSESLQEIATLIAEHERGLIVCGPRCPGGDFPWAAAELSRRSGYPIVADALSGLRYGPWVKDTVVCSDIQFPSQLAGHLPQMILRFGAVPTLQTSDFYQKSDVLVHVRANGVWADESHETSHFLQADESLTCHELSRRLPQHHGSNWQNGVRDREKAYQNALAKALDGDFFDGVILRDVVDLLAEEALLFVGNSLPVRHLNQFGTPSAKRLHVFANRGASGIDGNISTGLGIAAARREPVTLVVGDVTFYHDMNGLLAAGDHGLDVTIVLLNNGGGGIFRRLPVAEFEPPFTELFLTPHGLDFAHAARMYGFEHARVEARAPFGRRFASAVAEPGRRIIEVVTDSARDEARRQAVMEEVRMALASLPQDFASN